MYLDMFFIIYVKILGLFLNFGLYLFKILYSMIVVFFVVFFLRKKYDVKLYSKI